MAAIFADFPKNKCNFLHKNKLDIARRVQFLIERAERRPTRSLFSWGRRHHCPMEVGAYGRERTCILILNLLAEVAGVLTDYVRPSLPSSASSATHQFSADWVTHSQSRLAWSEPLRVGGHPALSLHSSNEPGELSQWLWSRRQHHKHCRSYHYYYIRWPTSANVQKTHNTSFKLLCCGFSGRWHLILNHRSY